MAATEAPLASLVDLAATVTSTRTRVVVTVSGELRIATVGMLEGSLWEAMSTGCREILLDASELRFVDASGLRSLIGARHQAAKRGKRFTITNASGSLMKLLRMSGMTALVAPAD